MNGALFSPWELVVLMFDDNKSVAGAIVSTKLDRIKDERGYLLIESLIGLILLSVITMSLITVLPILLDASARLDKEQAIYHHLFESHDKGIHRPHTITEPYEFDVFRRGDEWCATYVWRDQRARKICL